MRQSRVALFVMLAILSAAVVRGADDKELAKQLDDLNTRIKKSPDDPMLHYRKAQCLMKLGKCEEGYAAAKETLAVSVKTDFSLSWLLLESVDLDHVRVDVHFNMGPRERKPPKIGIVKPLSFRVWSKDKPAILEIIDFEIGMVNGKPETAALGQETVNMHANFGTLPTDSKYEDIKKKAIELIKKRNAVETKRKPEKAVTPGGAPLTVTPRVIEEEDRMGIQGPP
jgi:hypothetical protein